ncbi:DUF397 domain-containing protein [Goodfellowiella coeruleoviolacea]|uniref:DUF397 domain-containing protein n=1 Tax=Goodfellowiella coeruleoviolacea TaxID=334858 RepID=A0AAE3GKX5_9PSEU|nr:DUF397 domain-containing protein [Goodfellowiella coeruleoviolacea]MCP2167938.1 protein of unknown function (DUF397) [Goodfellowiella coeruleoviolacea]
MIDHDTLARANWRKSSYSGGGGPGNGNCVEAAVLPSDTIGIRDSKAPTAGVLRFSRSAVSAWIDHIKAGGYDTPA